VSRRTPSWFAVAWLLAVLATGVICAAARADVLLALSPAVQTVQPGSEFDITFQVTNATPAFNAFHLIVAYDPGALTAVKLSPVASQLGPLITSVCPNNVNWFHMGVGADTIDVSMLCAGASTSGPGSVYRMHFRASATPQVTTIRVLGEPQFADAGVLLANVSVTDAAVGIGMPPILAVDAPPPAPAALAATPNPARGDVTLDFGRPLASAATLAVHDLQGRVLRRVALAAGARTGAWDGRDDSGARVPPGQYVVVLRGDGAPRTVRVTQVR
jgi:hypothetical protein